MQKMQRDLFFSFAPALGRVVTLSDEMRRVWLRLGDSMLESWRLHLDRQALRSMSDEMLRDLGLDRTDVERLIRERCL